jgi:vacuolar-type H+-ATPase subunit I/STV1
VNQEWDVLESQERFEQSAIPSLRILLLKVEASDKVQEHVLSILDNSLVEITNLRRERLSHTRSYVPQLVWMILIISSVMVITFSYFLSIGPELLRKIFLTFLWGIIGLSLFLVYMLDHPFVGSTQVSKESYEEIIRSLSG